MLVLLPPFPIPGLDFLRVVVAVVVSAEPQKAIQAPDGVFLDLSVVGVERFEKKRDRRAVFHFSQHDIGDVMPLDLLVFGDSMEVRRGGGAHIDDLPENRVLAA